MANIESPSEYLGAQKKLHWAVVLLLALQYFVFDSMGRPFHRLIENGAAEYSTTVIAHICIGVAVLTLAIWRVSLRISHGAPRPPTGEPELGRLAAKYTHLLIYVMLFALPLGGLGAWFLRIEPLAGVHEAGSNILLGLVILHVLAVAVHHFVWKTDVLARMR